MVGFARLSGYWAAESFLSILHLASVTISRGVPSRSGPIIVLAVQILLAPPLREWVRLVIVDDVTRVLPELRAEAEALMVDACTVTGPGAPSWNDTTGTYTPGSPVTAYSGKCRVQVPVSVPGSHIGRRG